MVTMKIMLLALVLFLAGCGALTPVVPDGKSLPTGGCFYSSIDWSMGHAKVGYVGAQTAKPGTTVIIDPSTCVTTITNTDAPRPVPVVVVPPSGPILGNPPIPVTVVPPLVKEYIGPNGERLRIGPAQ